MPKLSAVADIGVRGEETGLAQGVADDGLAEGDGVGLGIEPNMAPGPGEGVGKTCEGGGAEGGGMSALDG